MEPHKLTHMWRRSYFRRLTSSESVADAGDGLDGYWRPAGIRSVETFMPCRGTYYRVCFRFSSSMGSGDWYKTNLKAPPAPIQHTVSANAVL